jgi:hypothetical protein
LFLNRLNVMRYAFFVLFLALLPGCTSPRVFSDGPEPLDGQAQGVWELVELDAERGLLALPMTDRVTLVVAPGTPPLVEGDLFSGPYRLTLRLDEAGQVQQTPAITNGPAAPHRLRLADREAYSPSLPDHLDHPQTAHEEPHAGLSGGADTPDRFDRRYRVPAAPLPRTLAELEHEYVRQWQFAQQVHVDGDELWVYGPRGVQLMRFQRPTTAQDSDS